MVKPLRETRWIWDYRVEFCTFHATDVIARICRPAAPYRIPGSSGMSLMMITLEAQLLVDCHATLGEGIQWNPARRRVYWTDVKGRTLWSCQEDGSGVARLDLETGLCSFAFSDDGRILGAFEDGLAWLDPVSGRRTLFEPYQPDKPTTRMNDGALDRQGRFVVGGIDEAELAPITPVWTVTRGEVRTIIDGVGCANSTAFSPDGSRMYFADSPTGEIQVFDYDIGRGIPSNRRVFARLRPSEGVPDGSTVDSQGGVWNAQYGGGAVQRFLPDGSRARRASRRPTSTGRRASTPSSTASPTRGCARA